MLIIPRMNQTRKNEHWNQYTHTHKKIRSKSIKNGNFLLHYHFIVWLESVSKQFIFGFIHWHKNPTNRSTYFMHSSNSIILKCSQSDTMSQIRLSFIRISNEFEWKHNRSVISDVQRHCTVIIYLNINYRFLDTC